MSEHEGTTHGYQRIQSKKTLKEILEVATSFEATARDFYTSLIPKVSKKMRWLVEELAAEEAGHYQLFSELAARPDIAGQIGAEVMTPASDRKFSDAVLLPDLGEHPDDQALLRYALGREHTAMEQYQSLADSTEPGPIHDLFVYLANEETKHKNELEKLYYEVVHSGGV
ncbi:MAG: ferritin family protein [Anderseniella sp.]|jgi:rubrerythrin|nr:ferritin family protein [Anderseniella sp.]